MTDISDESLPEWTAEELAVLRSADDDRPGPSSLGASLAAVGAGGAVATGAVAAKGATAVATAAKWGTFGVVAKWLGVVAVGGALVTGGVALVRSTPGGAPDLAGSRHSTNGAGAAPRKAPEAPATPASAGGEAPETVPAIPVVEIPVPLGPAPSGRRSVHAQPDISLEIAALDTARAALRGGRPSEALTALDRYDRDLAKGGSLRVESTILRIEALLKSGRRESATALASTFLARNPKSPYEQRIRALLGGGSTR